MIITAVYQCSEEPKDSPLKFNIYSSKKTSNTTEIRGNFTFGIPFDDSLIGEYRIVAAAIYQCADEPKNLPLKANLYLSKKSSNTTEVRGNCSLKIPFDDSLTIDINVASWSLTGGWKPNSLIYVTNNACSKAKSILGNSWFSIIKSFNSPFVNCPIPKGVYSSSGYDVTLINDNNFPKVYFYGKYKVVGKVKNKNNTIVGCLTAEGSLLRPWETAL
ncbi:uncharacterized protein LOC114130653 isoform X2 [Aphis gossypii]|uniref:uncharacterized protein LOC114130653 isoform X2 n=1 Tax=Aphis gossypii TaxID=80765 RepID=UPI00215921D1|nr:uncharacterized protein LOC114130653 isoform X2 [Aphis gossypii]